MEFIINEPYEKRMFYISWLPEYWHSMSDSLWHYAGSYVQEVIPLQQHPFPGQTLSSHKISIFTKPSPMNVTFLPLILCPWCSPYPMQSAFLAYLLGFISNWTFPWCFLWLLQTVGISLISPRSWDLLSIYQEISLTVLLSPPTLLKSIL